MWIRFCLRTLRSAFGYVSRRRAIGPARMRTTVVGHAIKCAGFRPFPRGVEPSSAVPYRRASQGMSLAPTSRQVHEMQSGLASFAFAIARPAGYQGDAFQASSPKNFPGRFWRPLFLPGRSRHSVSGAPSYRTFAYSDRLSSSMLMGVGVIQSAPRIGYGP
jgi:hypothetical protein